MELRETSLLHFSVQAGREKDERLLGKPHSSNHNQATTLKQPAHLSISATVRVFVIVDVVVGDESGGIDVLVTTPAGCLLLLLLWLGIADVVVADVDAVAADLRRLCW